MKKLLTIALLAITMAACGQKEEAPVEPTQTEVTTEATSGDAVEVTTEATSGDAVEVTTEAPAAETTSK